MTNLSFPTRFFQKLEIYQQISKGKGLAKHKRLWRQEAAFLKWAYGSGHQHLNSFLSYKRFKDEVTAAMHGQGLSMEKPEETIGNLFFQGLIDLRDKKSREINPENAKAEDKKFSDKFDIRPSLLGLEVGEVLSEINNPNWIVRWGNEVKYSACISLIWIVLGMSIAYLSFLTWGIVLKTFDI